MRKLILLCAIVAVVLALTGCPKDECNYDPASGLCNPPW